MTDIPSQKVKYLTFSGQVDEQMCERLMEALVEAREDKAVEKVVWYLTSYGGVSDVALGIHDVIKGFEKPLTMVAVGGFHSAAVVVLQAAMERLALPHTNFMIHPMEYTEEAHTSVFQAENDSKYFQRLERTKLEILSERVGMSVEELSGVYKDKIYLSAEEALSFGSKGLIDRIVERI